MKSGASNPFGDEDGEDNEDGTPPADDEVAESEEAVASTGDGADQSQPNDDVGTQPSDGVGTQPSDGVGTQPNTGVGTGTDRGQSDKSADDESGDAENARMTGGSVDDENARTTGGSASGLDRSQIPYTLRRNNVKDERPHVHQLFVTDDTDDAAREAERALEDTLDTDVYRLDAREAIYRIGMRHPEEVAELLEEWGYNF